MKVGLEACLCDGLAWALDWHQLCWSRWSLDWQQLLGEGEHRCWDWWVLDWHREGVGWEVGGWEVGWGEHGWSGLGQGGQLGRRERPRKDWALGDTGDSTGGLAGVVVGGARIDGDLQGIRTGWGRFMARGCGVRGQQGDLWSIWF